MFFGNKSIVLLKDKYGRSFSYLRLSITNICNFRCSYCLPFGYKKTEKLLSVLNLCEIDNLINAFSCLGLEKVRLTGGEPTVRKEFFEISRLILSYRNIKYLAFTTNGYQLDIIAEKCFDFGFSCVNVSVDSLVREKFYSITGRDYLTKVLNGIKLALLVGLKVKVNVVFLSCFSIFDFDLFLDYVTMRCVSVRFIELVGTKNTIEFFEKNYTSLFFLRNYLEKFGWSKSIPNINDGPAVTYTHNDYKGSVGFITSYSANFCLHCNRLRVSANGDFYLCLFGGSEKIFPLKYLLSLPFSEKHLVNYIKEIVMFKDLSHFLLNGKLGKVDQLSEIGG